jgi:hypothetical protein
MNSYGELDPKRVLWVKFAVKVDFDNRYDHVKSVLSVGDNKPSVLTSGSLRVLLTWHSH